MAKQTSSSDSSLPLHEVLEAEFVALHGELPSDYPGSSEPKTRLKALYDAIHGLKEKRAALASRAAVSGAQRLDWEFCRASRAADCSISSTTYLLSRAVDTLAVG